MKHKDVRRAEAKARQEEYDALTLDQKITRAQARRGQSKRELNRLLSLKGQEEKNG